MSQNLSLKSFVVLMKAAKSMQEKIKQDVSNYGVNLSEFTVLEALYHKGQMTVQQICSKVLIASGSMTYVIDKLEKKGMLERKACPEDRRVVHLMLTEAGKAFMEKVFPKHQQLIEDIFGDVSEKEKEMLIDLLKRIGQRANNI
ncbi:MarR family transcriptional regulator [Siminovitchia fortis]|uniref:MarR family transcriptional regulator n=1 Tax=Siminovitchia fortis TaxID=254758 RepID=A0A443IZP1_9BACI|nr:MarR family transcriptional regulator [Siminovitchia fortis]RWR13613.1 MarR family transcriptional regulator [Siminovitchia fortis]WHY81927.1 MarR family transcriptional regulator [Siminovitchia fortis]